METEGGFALRLLGGGLFCERARASLWSWAVLGALGSGPRGAEADRLGEVEVDLEAEVGGREAEDLRLGFGTAD